MHYFAPEIMRHRHGWELKKSDMWAVGVISYLLVCGKLPFRGDSRSQILHQIMTCKYKFPGNIELSVPCRAFIRSLLQFDCHKRMSSKDALKHPWIVSEAADTRLAQPFFANIGDFHRAGKFTKILVELSF